MSGEILLALARSLGKRLLAPVVMIVSSTLHHSFVFACVAQCRSVDIGGAEREVPPPGQAVVVPVRRRNRNLRNGGAVLSHGKSDMRRAITMQVTILIADGLSCAYLCFQGVLCMKRIRDQRMSRYIQLLSHAEVQEQLRDSISV